MKYLLLLVSILSLSANSANGQGWSEFGIGIAGINANGQIISVTGDRSGTLYTSGAFVLAGARNVYTWQSTHWEQLGELNANWWLATMCTDTQKNLYVAGAFSNLSGYRAVVKWDGSIWKQVGSGSNMLYADSTIWSVCAGNTGDIFASGDFRNATGYNYVARWDGSVWTEAGKSFGPLNANGRIYAMCIDNNGDVYAGGYFNHGSGKYYVARWDHTSNAWTKIGAYFNGPVFSLYAGKNGEIYAGGAFTDAGGYEYVASWDGMSWTPIGSGANAMNATGVIFCITEGNDGNIFAGGTFKNAANFCYVAYWNGVAWSELGAGTKSLNANSSIFTLYNDRVSGYLYTAGNFTNDFGKYYVARCKLPGTVQVDQPAAPTGVSIYPNPCREQFTIEIPGVHTNGSYTIEDINGRTLSSGHIEQKSQSLIINTMAYTPGNYMVRLNFGAGTVIKKLTVVR